MLTASPATRRLRDQVQAACAARRSLDVQGGLTKAFYGGERSGEPLCVKELSGISSYQPDELVITAKAGTLVQEIEDVLAAKGQCLAFEPPCFGEGGTLGGMVASGLTGPAWIRSGPIRNYVLGTTMLNGRAEMLTFGGQVMKNVAGYDISRLLVGSLGVLGLVLEASLRVSPRPASSLTLAFPVGVVGALDCMTRWRSRPLPISASAWHDGTLWIRLSGSTSATRSARIELGGGLIPEDDAAALWQSIRNHRHPFFAAPAPAPTWRIAVPATAKPLPLQGSQLIEWGGALRWWRTDVAPHEVRELAQQRGGQASLFCGSVDRSNAFPPLGQPLLRIHKALKAAFDPHAVFNRGRLSPEF